MDFDKTSFSVDWYAPGDGYVHKRLSFPKSARISMDDLVADSPLSFCFSPADGTMLRPRAYSFVDSSLEAARGWTNSAPPSPIASSDCEQCPVYGQDGREVEEDSTDWRTLASPGVLSLADDCASCGVDVDVTCLDTLDERLLLSPVGCFTDMCWAAAVCEGVTAPVASTPRSTHSFKRGSERPSAPPLPKDYSGSLDCARPLATRITLPLGRVPHYPSSPSCDSLDTSAVFQDKEVDYLQDVDSKWRVLPPLPSQGVPVPRRSKKRDAAPTRTPEPLMPSQPPPTPRLRQSKSSQTLRAISEACSTFVRARRRLH